MPPAIISSYDTSRAEPRATTRAKTREALAELGLSCVKKIRSNPSLSNFYPKIRGSHELEFRIPSIP